MYTKKSVHQLFANVLIQALLIFVIWNHAIITTGYGNSDGEDNRPDSIEVNYPPTPTPVLIADLGNPTPTPTNTPTPTPTPCVETWTVTGSGTIPLPDSLKDPINTLASTLGVAIDSAEFSQTTKAGQCCFSNGTAGDRTSQSGGVNVTLLANDVSLLGRVFDRNISVFGVTYRIKAQVGVVLNGSFSVSGSGTIIVSDCSGTCLDGDLTFEFTTTLSLTFSAQLCQKVTTSENCTCITLNPVSADFGASGSILYSCSGGNLSGSVGDIPIKSKINVGVGSCSLDYTYTWTTIAGYSL